MVTSEFQRARRPEHKEQRREAILAAARRLATRDGVRVVSLGDIAAEVGVHKSALLRYFETREEIYLRLTAECWAEWAGALRAELPAAESAPAAVAAVITRTLVERPLFCDLLTHAPLSLERHVSMESVRAYKVGAIERVNEISGLLGDALPGLGVDGGRKAVTAVTAFAATLWQVSHPPETLAAFYAEEPEFGHSVLDFAARLEELTAAVLAGLVQG
ncbi:TetR/AcrR family transcriptional regulator [Amycolatopsis thermoflava]|uniref:TetR family transcriptional regulator n=1 Tax=Amycolatopsis thermoflava TaxID=84480 RepID=A0A3N2H729_9PSEU|nr:TetR/AcrR family transcriptional regulator [Amycolatopsis thermoflava]ROS44722.1 TetR family transcriptional regulator [Amycolatopsis thermoflava]